MALIPHATLRTDVGVVRERNEDSAWVDERGRFAIVADGMGGHGAGDVASSMAVALVREALESEDELLTSYARNPTDAGRALLGARMRRAVEAANAEVYARSEREPELHQMGSTLELVVVAGDEALIAHVGDSRTYLVRNGRAAQLTTDHTVAETMRRSGALTDDEARVSPMRSVLSNAIGVTPTVTVDLVRMRLVPGDRLLVCSDGLHDYFTREELAAHVSGGDAEQVLARLIEHARDGGGHDNITGIVIETRTRPAATHPGVVDGDEVEDAPTSPISVPHEVSPRAASAPLEGMSEDTLVRFIESSLAESSRPHRVGGGN